MISVCDSHAKLYFTFPGLKLFSHFLSIISFFLFSASVTDVINLGDVCSTLSWVSKALLNEAVCRTKKVTLNWSVERPDSLVKNRNKWLYWSHVQVGSSRGQEDFYFIFYYIYLINTKRESEYIIYTYSVSSKC